MPAKLVIVAGEPQGKEFWIEDEVLRIGSGPNCGVRLTSPDVPAHAATLEYHDGSYSVHNRSDKVLLLGGQILEERDFAVWSAGGELQLGAHTVLRLHLDADPAPARQQTPFYTEEDDEAADDEPVEAKVKGKSKTMTYVAVIALCLVAFAGLLLLDQMAPKTDKSGAPGDQRNEFKEFHFLVQELTSIENNDSKADEHDGLSAHDAGQLRKQLQTGRVAELRGDRHEARKWYSQIRDQLLRKRNKPGARFSEVEEKLWDFVLAQMNRKAKAADVF
jgi:hypothetical protein